MLKILACRSWGNILLRQRTPRAAGSSGIQLSTFQITTQKIMIFRIPYILLHLPVLQLAACFHTTIAGNSDHSNPVATPDPIPNNQEFLEMGASWSNPAHNGQQIIKPVESVNVDSQKDPRSRRLTHLLKANHINHAINYHELRFHNHMAHILGSAYFLESSPEHLTEIYDEESKELEPWTDSPGEIAPHDWRNHLGDRRYQRAYLDFFEDEMVNRSYDWKGTVMHFLLEGDKPLLHGLVDGFGHPLIHLGYAFEMENREVAMEALAMAATAYNNIHEFSDNPNPPLPYVTYNNILNLLANIREDFRLDGEFRHAAPENAEKVLGEMVMQLWERANSFVFTIEELSSVYERQVDAAVLIFLTGHKKGDPQYDFFLAHLVTTAHALRIVLPLLSFQQAWHVIKSHVVLTVVVYISQCRPLIKKELLNEVSTEGKGWDYINRKALEGDARFDAHYVKALRAFHEFEKLFGEKDGFYLKAAVKFADEFVHWTGFGAGNPELDIKK
ncbi:hypothetical protein ABW19_dt0203352 [Dactylella cylindrospora]|nr:hypothetical protein ABW19_dt0203352 [Dactylella cylindrospora]